MPFSEYNDFVIGKKIGPIEITVDAQRVRDFVYSVDDFNPWHLYDSPFGWPIAPVPLLTSDDPDFAALQELGKEDALAAKFEIRSLEPIRIGERVALRGLNVDKYIRRSKGYIVRGFEVLAAGDGRSLIKSRLTEMVGVHPDGEVRDSRAHQSDSPQRIEPRESSQPMVLRATRNIPLGSPLRALTKKVTRKQMFVFSARPGWWTSIHTDPDYARSLGFPDAIAQALMSTGYVSQLCTEFFQESWFRTGFTSLTFVRPVCVDDVLHIEGCVTNYTREPNAKTRLELEVWCKNQRGEPTTVGRASAAID
jgi:acyl dehydratase